MFGPAEDPRGSLGSGERKCDRVWIVELPRCDLSCLDRGRRSLAKASIHAPKSKNPRLKSKNPRLKGKDPRIKSKDPCLESKKPCLKSKNPRLKSKTPCLKSKRQRLKSKNPRLRSKEPTRVGCQSLTRVSVTLFVWCGLVCPEGANCFNGMLLEQ